ncbi:MAG TPA: HAMP domain-containing sensor histidine kinase [Longimicrobiaceae bacterium]|nr:HAMP domain-containing sensor histidine kinase [Longimicrobiaceae bacterium]
MSREERTPSLRREIVVWYSVVLLLALGTFSGLTFVLMQQALEWSGRSSLEQSARAVENLAVPPSVPRIRTQEQIVRMREGGPKVIRRRTQFATGETLETWFWLPQEAEQYALRAFALIALLLIPLTAGLAAWGGRALLERLLAPLDRLVQATHQIGIAGLSRRVEEPLRPAEMQELAQSFNGMLTRLQRAVQAMERFTADASHELRTPLTSIKGTVQVALSRERPAAELQETLGEVLEETEWMLHLVDGLLTLARGEEATEDERVPVPLSELLEDVGEVGEALAVGKPVEVTIDVPPGLHVVGSPGQLRQVFLNLVSNAVKFTEEGRVAISAASAEGGQWVEVRVRDTGVGIDAEELAHVFDRFYRGDAARGPGGTGLGLAIARLLVERQGGTISVTSERGRGSEFLVRLPVTPPALPLPTAAGSDPEG